MKYAKDSLGDRMKGYENISRHYLTKRLPVVIRCDGKAFHTFTKGFQKPFDMVLMETMWNTAQYLCEHIQGCKLAYVQSDEITLLLTDYESINTCSWFDNNIQKMVSISASMATLAFNKSFDENVSKFYTEHITNDWTSDWVDELINKYNMRKNTALFDSRAFTVPKEEVCNNFIWRQQDATRNSIQMVARANFSHKQLNNKSCDEIQEMLFQEKGLNFNDLPIYQKRGVCIIKEQYKKDEAIRNRWVVDKEIPIFTQDRNYIDKYIFPTED